jgi:hypothetical protein
VNDRDLRVSLSAVVWGVVMSIEVGVDVRLVVGVNRGLRWVRRDMCSSDVPICQSAVTANRRTTQLRTWRRIDNKII